MVMEAQTGGELEATMLKGINQISGDLEPESIVRATEKFSGI